MKEGPHREACDDDVNRLFCCSVAIDQSMKCYGARHGVIIDSIQPALPKLYLSVQKTGPSKWSEQLNWAAGPSHVLLWGFVGPGRVRVRVRFGSGPGLNNSLTSGRVGTFLMADVAANVSKVGIQLVISKRLSIISGRSIHLQWKLQRIGLFSGCRSASRGIQLTPQQTLIDESCLWVRPIFHCSDWWWPTFTTASSSSTCHCLAPKVPKVPKAPKASRLQGFKPPRSQESKKPSSVWLRSSNYQTLSVMDNSISRITFINDFNRVKFSVYEAERQPLSPSSLAISFFSWPVASSCI